MKILKILGWIFFVICCSFLGLFAGTSFGGMFVPEGSGLAGPAIALSYGLGGVVLFLIIAILLIRILNSNAYKIVFSLVVLSAIGSLIFLTIRFQNKQKEKQQDKNENVRLPTKPVPEMKSPFRLIGNYSIQNEENFDQELGVGIASVKLDDSKTFRFYAPPLINQLQEEAVKIDSVVFVQKQTGIDIYSAPSFLYPENLKLDYQIFNFRVITLSREWLEVVVNKQSKQTAWIRMEDVNYKSWPDFLLAVYSIESVNYKTNPVRYIANDGSSVLSDEKGIQFFPLSVKGDWLMLSTHNLPGTKPSTGWIRWKKDNKLLVSYSLLS